MAYAFWLPLLLSSPFPATFCSGNRVLTSVCKQTCFDNCIGRSWPVQFPGSRMSVLIPSLQNPSDMDSSSLTDLIDLFPPFFCGFPLFSSPQFFLNGVTVSVIIGKYIFLLMEINDDKKEMPSKMVYFQ